MGNEEKSDDDNQTREPDPRDRIRAFVQAHQEPRPKPVAEEDLQTLKTAAGKLDQLLDKVAQDAQARSTQVTDEDLKALKAAAGRLDDLLAGRGQRERE